MLITQPVEKFNSFTVDGRQGEQFITMRAEFGDSEDIKIEATMFDGFVSVPRVGDDASGEDLRIHSSVIVDITKRDDSRTLEFVCSAWPEALEVHNFFVFDSLCNNKQRRPYIGPHFGYIIMSFARIWFDFFRYLIYVLMFAGS